MADRPQPHHIQVRPAQPRYGEHEYGEHGGFGDGGPSAGQVLAVITGLPLGGTLLALAGLTLLGTVIGALVATPLFIIFSPVLVPALFVIGLAVTGFLTSGAFGLTGLSALSWITNYLRRTPVVPETLDEAKRRAAEMGEYVGQKTKEVGQDIQNYTLMLQMNTKFEKLSEPDEIGFPVVRQTKGFSLRRMLGFGTTSFGLHVSRLVCFVRYPKLRTLDAAANWLCEEPTSSKMELRCDCPSMPPTENTN
ncbi:hypothetical protein PS1_023793 [Malus domestica]